MGSRMATAFIVEHPDSGIAGFIGVGIKKGAKYPLDSLATFEDKNPRCLMYTETAAMVKTKLEAEVRSDMVSDLYKQVLIPKPIINHQC